MRAAYTEIRTPIFEQADLFDALSENTDFIGKEIYSFHDKDENSISLRPEGTAGVVRAVIEHSLYTQGAVQRLWYAGAMFRYESPSVVRQRQFHQLGVEVLGSGEASSDAEVIAIACDILQTLGLNNLRLEINSVGISDNRKCYESAIIDYLKPYEQDLDPSQQYLTRNPLRIFDSKNPRTQEITQNAPSILDYLDFFSQRRFERVQQLLSDLGIAYTVNSRVLRGLDYYTHTTFEIISDDLEQATICGGGRYDNLVGQLGGSQMPAVGWAIGLERLILLLQQFQTPFLPKLDFYIVSKGDLAESQALVLAQKLRILGFSVQLDLSGNGFRKQFTQAERSGTVACLIVGDEEAKKKTVKLKWMATKQQESLAQVEFLAKSEELRQQIVTLNTNV
jgi:histidyl-tRNA synthetase